VTQSSRPLAAIRASGTVARPQAMAAGGFPIHSTERPQPPVVTPGPAGAPVPPPSDAVVLFDGKSLERWRSADTASPGPARWKVMDGYMEVAPQSGSIETVDGFGDAHLHVEWATPVPPKGTGQDRGNSGVFLMGNYEVQVLDSHGNTTYPDG
jgi:hypothetical protein